MTAPKDDAGTSDHREARAVRTPRLKPIVFNAGDILFEEGETADKAYVIQSGSILITAIRDGVEIEIARLGRGEFVGEMALVDDAPRSATAIAEETSECILLTKTTFDKILGRADVVTAALIRLLAKRLRDLTGRVTSG